MMGAGGYESTGIDHPVPSCDGIPQPDRAVVQYCVERHGLHAIGQCGVAERAGRRAEETRHCQSNTKLIENTR